ncbi:hypothetical protein [Alkalicoccus daliensis]|uniref:YhfM-like domain-containing protein n=1 Tax=Alkalicoccus daliensis TaxID=745820 RepID=A0A1H0CSH4_9BACI|nr:hypothetical protein [Alkalicoccus daliensis]SDN60631.1 hypothetical protein SAMN04488053_102208 [Alkalicoccus daliensis]
MMKLSIAGLMIFGLLTAGCSFGLYVNSFSVDEIRLYETDSFYSENLELFEVYEESKDIKRFLRAVNNTSKLDGAVDMADPDFEVDLIKEGELFKGYYLWVSEDGASLMDRDDTHTLYRVKEKGQEIFRGVTAVEE